MAKSPDAFRTISEVADWLGVEAHVLRFWETKFNQVKPVKRAGGRRYYRPSDMALLGGIRRLLHDDGMTIRGVQKVLRDKGVAHVSGLSPQLGLDGAALAPTALEGRASSKRPDGDGRTAPAAAAPVDDDAPTLPFEFATAPGAAPEPALEAANPGGDGPSRSNGPSGADGVPAKAASAEPAPLRIRSRAAQLDPAVAADVLARARALVERLRNTPE